MQLSNMNDTHREIVIAEAKTALALLQQFLQYPQLANITASKSSDGTLTRWTNFELDFEGGVELSVSLSVEK